MLSLGQPPNRASQSAQRAAPSRPTIDPKDRFLLVPYGKYAGTLDKIDVTLWLKEDQTFDLKWVNNLTREQVQWSGEFEWIKGPVAETLELYEVREAVNARVKDGKQTVKLAVMGIDKETNSFRLAISRIGHGDVAFKPAN